MIPHVRPRSYETGTEIYKVHNSPYLTFHLAKKEKKSEAEYNTVPCLSSCRLSLSIA